MTLARVSQSPPSVLPSPLLQSIIRIFSSSACPIHSSRRRSSLIAAAFSQVSQSPHDVREGHVMVAPRPSSRRHWKPTCLYYTQGKCTMVRLLPLCMNDATHLEKFSHSLTMDLPVNVSAADKVKPQKFDYLLILDLEGKVEILEFPVMMIDAQSMEFIDSFHSVWHDTAIPFKQVLQEFEDWMENNNLWKKKQGGSLKSAAFVTCGNWDLKTKVPEQCKVSKIKLPTYFMEWINVKDIYLNFYRRRATGMMTMMRELQMPIVGSHHLGIDDSKNIARVVQRMLAEGAVMQITAKRQSSTGGVNFLFRDRIR
nr:unnamed protein product [Digitaria exilis]